MVIIQKCEHTFCTVLEIWWSEILNNYIAKSAAFVGLQLARMTYSLMYADCE